MVCIEFMAPRCAAGLPRISYARACTDENKRAVLEQTEEVLALWARHGIDTDYGRSPSRLLCDATVLVGLSDQFPHVATSTITMSNEECISGRMPIGLPVFNVPTAARPESEPDAEAENRIDCVGVFSACTGACEIASERVFVQTVAPSGHGAACPAAAPACQRGDGECQSPELADFSATVPQHNMEGTSVGVDAVEDVATTMPLEVALPQSHYATPSNNTGCIAGEIGSGCPALLFVDADGPLGSLILMLTVSLTFGGCAYACVRRYETDNGGTTKRSVKHFFGIELVDAISDVITLVFTSAEGDLVFSNDPAGLVYIFLSASVLFSVLAGGIEVCLYHQMRHAAFKDALAGLYCLHVVFEDLFQAFAYIWVSASQAQIMGGAALGAVQASLFVGLRMCELFGGAKTAPQPRGAAPPPPRGAAPLPPYSYGARPGILHGDVLQNSRYDEV